MGELPFSEGQERDMRRPILGAQARVRVPLEEARDWFLSLKEHPERYEFDTHEGFKFVQGSFGEVGARFRTREKFLFVRIELLFELTAIRESAFRFRLVRPFSGVWGRFDLEEMGDGETSLSLVVGSETRGGQLLLSCYPVAAVVHRQIQREVSHIKASMESVSRD